MKTYKEEEQKKILHAMDSDILALVVVDTATCDFEVVYSNGAYRDYANGHRSSDFFGKWKTEGLPQVDPRDRKRLGKEIDRDWLLDHLDEEGCFSTTGRFMADGEPVFCRIKVKKDVLEEGTLAMGIRNIDREIRMERERALLEDRLLREKKEMEETQRRMRMKTFMSRMHPHFLFNALSSIREVVLADPGYGADLLYDFTTFLRAGVRAMNSDEEISFAKELENVRAYVNIEKMRMGGRLEVVYDISADDFMIIPFSVQPLVENAIRHGIYESKRPRGTVTVRSYEAGDCYVVEVNDDGAGFDVVETIKAIAAGKKDSTGLYNLKFRLEEMMGASVNVDSTPGEGTFVTLRFPKR